MSKRVNVKQKQSPSHSLLSLANLPRIILVPLFLVQEIKRGEQRQ